MIKLFSKKFKIDFLLAYYYNIMLDHVKGWTKQHHYCTIGGQCGQSCPCCRAELYLSNIDPDAKLGACEICIYKNKKKNKKSSKNIKNKK